MGIGLDGLDLNQLCCARTNKTNCAPLVVPRNEFGVPRNEFGVPRNKFGVPRNEFGNWAIGTRPGLRQDSRDTPLNRPTRRLFSGEKYKRRQGQFK